MAVQAYSFAHGVYDTVGLSITKTMAIFQRKSVRTTDRISYIKFELSSSIHVRYDRSSATTHKCG